MNETSICRVLILMTLATPWMSLFADEQAVRFPVPINTQAPGEHPPSPREMLKLFEVPEGFVVKLFAGEPDVQQPVSFDFDDKGRIWVAENYTYSAHGKIDPTLRDRIVILHDTDSDGEHDQRKVFWDRGSMLTSLTWGFGGLWILNDGTLSFIPDRNGDDIPDSEPVVMLNGWTKNAGHNFVSGLMWGPDGWLYGRHGITDSSSPGTPDTPESERQVINCGIWRFHPQRHTFEVVCNGTTNPWGLDYNVDGQFFFTNNVIGHLWHVVPGAHYERMFGQDFNPHLYELMGQTADHYHWDHSGNWTESRDGKADDLGGGHSHCGGLIYQGENLPERFRGCMFMCNTHGRCINADSLERQGSGYVAHHTPNLLKVNSPWFRGVELRSGPDGCLYVSDWSDNGECHDHDGVHRTSGRIYRISFGDVRVKAPSDLSGADLQQLTNEAIHGTHWMSRRARRHLQERNILHDARPGSEHRGDMITVHRAAEAVLASNAESRDAKLRSLWLLESLDGLSLRVLAKVLESNDEALIAWTIPRAVEHRHLQSPPVDPSRAFDSTDPGQAAPLLELCRNTNSGLVLLSIASSLQKLDGRTRLMVAKELIQRLHEFGDQNLLLMTWYGLVNEVSPAALLYVLSGQNAPPKLLQFVARRVVQLPGQSGAVTSQLLAPYGPAQTDAGRIAVLTGMLEGLRGQHKPTAPPTWASDQKQLQLSANPAVVQLAKQLAVLYGDGAAIADLRHLIADRNGDHAARSQAIKALAESSDAQSLPVLIGLLNDRAVYVDVAKALAAFDDERVPVALLRHWKNLRHGAREAAMDTLCSRKSYALRLGQALTRGEVSSEDLTAAHVRQLNTFQDDALAAILAEKWGVINESSEAKAAAIANWKARLTPDFLADASYDEGAALFRKTCAACHRLYGEGGQIGPDLTGSNRGNLDYLLGNIVDPSAEVPKQFTVSVIALTSGRVLTGVVVAETEQSIGVQTDKELMMIPRKDIEERNTTTKSLMPDGLLDTLSEQQVRDLVAFIRQKR
ncbi:MAG: c-type cytochrome [Planctomycetaceae bacterium]